ncbi:MAG: hypothetical protein ACLQUY_20215 [Ktedonobacterales bacterium]
MNARRDTATAQHQTPSGPSVSPGAGVDAKQDTTTAGHGVLDVLEHEQLSSVRYTAHVGRLALRPRTLVLFWALRVYVVVMMILVAQQIWVALHP